ncbi:putative pre-16S rRNA nuclease [subsurface metagenome]
MGRLLAVDPGTRRVGLALSDPLQIIASPFSTIPFKNDKKFIKDLLRIIKDKDVETVIIGLPLKEKELAELL